MTSTSNSSDDDDAVELFDRRRHDADDRAVAAAVRSALGDGDSWTDSQLHQIARAADRRAEQRRRQRRVRTPVVLLASAAAVAGLVVVPQVLPTKGGSGPEPAGTGPTSGLPGTEPVLLTDAEVHDVLPDADPVGYGSDPAAVPPVPMDACGTATLSGVSAPISSQSAQWGTPGREEREQQLATEPGGGGGTLIQLMVVVDTFADSAQANGYADALSESTSTCTPADGAQHPVYPFQTTSFIAPSLYVTGYSGGVLAVTAVEVDGAHTATVHAWVPVAEDPTTVSPGPDEPVAPVPGADGRSLGSAVRAVVGLATSAAERAASS